MNEYISKEHLKQTLLNLECKTSSLIRKNFVESTLHKLMPQIIDDEPVADVQPVKHGRWSECYTDTHHYSGICTVCGRASIKSLTESLYEYCPKCGARMDGDVG